MYKDKGYRVEPCSNSKNHRLPFDVDLRVFVYEDIDPYDLEFIKRDKLNFTAGGEFLVLIHEDAIVGIVGWKYKIINDIIFLEYNAGWVHPKYRHKGLYNFLFAERECLVSETFDVPYKHFYTFATLSSLPTFLKYGFVEDTALSISDIHFINYMKEQGTLLTKVIRNDVYKEEEVAYAKIH